MEALIFHTALNTPNNYLVSTNLMQSIALTSLVQYSNADSSSTFLTSERIGLVQEQISSNVNRLYVFLLSKIGVTFVTFLQVIPLIISMGSSIFKRSSFFNSSASSVNFLISVVKEYNAIAFTSKFSFFILKPLSLKVNGSGFSPHRFDVVANTLKFNF